MQSFWAVEIQPGKEYTATPDFDVHVTQAVLAANSKDKERTVVSAKVEAEEGEKAQSFAIASLRLESHESQTLDLLFDATTPVTFSVTGKNPVHLTGYLVPPADDEDMFGEEGEFDEDEEGLEGSEDEEELSEDDLVQRIAKIQGKNPQGNGQQKRKGEPMQIDTQGKKPKQENQGPKKEHQGEKKEQQGEKKEQQGVDGQQKKKKHKKNKNKEGQNGNAEQSSALKEGEQQPKTPKKEGDQKPKEQNKGETPKPKQNNQPKQTPVKVGEN